MPLCLGTSGSVRASKSPNFDKWASVVHTFCPLRSHSSPSATARVERLATSDPEPGSLNNWHQISSAVNSGRR